MLIVLEDYMNSVMLEYIGAINICTQIRAIKHICRTYTGRDLHIDLYTYVCICLCLCEILQNASRIISEHTEKLDLIF